MNNFSVLFNHIDMCLFIIRVHLQWYEIDKETGAEFNYDTNKTVHIFLNPQSAKRTFDSMNINDFMNAYTQERTELAILTLEKWNVDEYNAAYQNEILKGRDLLS